MCSINEVDFLMPKAHFRYASCFNGVAVNLELLAALMPTTTSAVWFQNNMKVIIGSLKKIATLLIVPRVVQAQRVLTYIDFS